MKICLVEDDLLLGRALSTSLEDAGHKVVWLRMAADARPWLGDESLDAAILDLGLPDGEGITLLREMRRSGNQLPVLIVTARDTLDERLDGLDAGADDYLIKPFDNAELLARLRAVLRRGGKWSEDEAVLRRGGLSLDEQGMTVKLEDKVLSLSPTEFALLRELLRYKNRVRTRRQLENEAMPDSDSQSLDVHISNLRRKIGADVIRTVRGVGYVVDDDLKQESMT